VKLLSGRLAPMSGRITRPDKLEIAYFAQHQLEELASEDSAFDHLRRLLPDQPESKVRARAGAIGFPAAKADTPAGRLSGGERARLLLGLATLGGAHLIVLDEPTNHLDIDSRAALINGINTYPGAVILVSHDRYLIEACADRLWLVAGGRVAPFEGDLDEYRDVVLAERGAALPLPPARAGEGKGGSDRRAGAAPRARVEIRRAAAEKRTELAPLRRRIAEAETAVKRLGREIAGIDSALAKPGLFARDPARAAALAKGRADAVNALARAEDDWLAASAALESAMS
jgi:ATP-binding cassette subfamily F protein 3